VNAREDWVTVWLRMGIQKSMPSLVKQIKAIKLKSERGTKLWISKVEPASPKKVHVQIQLLKSPNQVELLDVDSLMQTLKAKISKIELAQYKDPIVKNIVDGHVSQDTLEGQVSFGGFGGF